MALTQREIWSEASDATLVGGISRYDQDALAEVYRRHGGAMFGLATRLLRDRTLAEETTQEVMLRLWNAPEKYEAERGALRSYLLAHIHGRSIDLIRSESSRRTREEREARLAIVNSGQSLEEEVWTMAVGDHVKDALADLNDGEREAIELAYFGGHTYREVASILGQPEGTVKSRIRGGLKRLRSSMLEVGVTA